MSALVGLVAFGSVTSVVLADTSTAGAAMGDISVTARRARAKPTEAGWPRAPVNEVALTYTVSPASFDLTTAAGRAGLEKAVNDTAMDVCKEIGKQYPGSTPEDAGCAKAAADKAMVKVREVEAAATAPKKAAK